MNLARDIYAVLELCPGDQHFRIDGSYWVQVAYAAPGRLRRIQVFEQVRWGAFASVVVDFEGRKLSFRPLDTACSRDLAMAGILLARRSFEVPYVSFKTHLRTWSQVDLRPRAPPPPAPYKWALMRGKR